MWCSPGVRSSSPACMAKIVTAGLASANCSPAKARFRLTTRTTQAWQHFRAPHCTANPQACDFRYSNAPRSMRYARNN